MKVENIDMAKLEKEVCFLIGYIQMTKTVHIFKKNR